MRDTTIESMLKRTVKLNGLLIPVSSIENTLSQYTHPLLVWNQNNDLYPFSLMGSSLGIYYRNRYLLICTRHQLKNVLDGRSFEDVGLLDKDGGNFCTAGGIRHFNDNLNEVDLHDVVAFDFTAPCIDRPHMRERFFQISESPPNAPSNDIIGFVVSGFPTDKQGYNLEESRRMDFVRAKKVCTLSPFEDQSKDPTIFKITSLDNVNFKPDGMSGGAAFVIQIVDGVGYANLAGLVVRAGNNNFYILKVGHILDFINSWLDE